MSIKCESNLAALERERLQRVIWHYYSKVCEACDPIKLQQWLLFAFFFLRVYLSMNVCVCELFRMLAVARLDLTAAWREKRQSQALREYGEV